MRGIYSQTRTAVRYPKDLPALIIVLNPFQKGPTTGTNGYTTHLQPKRGKLKPEMIAKKSPKRGVQMNLTRNPLLQGVLTKRSLRTRLYNENRIGDSTHPYRSPALTSNASDIASLTLTSHFTSLYAASTNVSTFLLAPCSADAPIALLAMIRIEFINRYQFAPCQILALGLTWGPMKHYTTNARKVDILGKVTKNR